MDHEFAEIKKKNKCYGTEITINKQKINKRFHLGLKSTNKVCKSILCYLMIALKHSTLFRSKLKLNSFFYNSPIFKFSFVEFG